MTINNQSIIEMKDISIEFPGVQALSNMDFTVKTGTINALIGANGAGKSTLMKVLSGAHNHYTGSIYLDNKEVIIKRPKDAVNLGIDIVYQEVDTALVSYLSVAENIMLDEIVNFMGKKQRVNWKEIHKKSNEVLDELNIDLDTKKLVSNLSLAEKQMVLIARAIVKKGNFLILDEPTAPLSNSETKELFAVIRQLAYKKNVGVIFISHRLPELFEICERVTVMRNGKGTGTEHMSDVNQKQLVDMMLGDTTVQDYSRNETKLKNKILIVEKLNDKNGKIKNIDLKVHSGEIVGIAGLVGAGKTEILKTIFGAEKIRSGAIKVNNIKTFNKSPFHAVKNKIALVPEERRKEGVLVEESICSNLTAPNLKTYINKFGYLLPKKEKKNAVKMIKSIGIKTPNESQKVSLLSGGNQQKVAIGKWLMSDAEIFLFDEPTKGVDVGAKAEIYNLISDLAKNSKGIVYATSELDEIMKITDKVYVVYDGKIVKEFLTKETSKEEILYYSTGGK